jgi:hypothetical protein
VQPEHQVRNDRPANSSYTLHKHVRHCFGPGNTVLNCVSKRDGWIQVCARNRTKRQNESDQCRTSRNRVRKQCDGDVPARQPFTHDAGPDYGSDKEPATYKLSRQSGADVELHW